MTRRVCRSVCCPGSSCLLAIDGPQDPVVVLRGSDDSAEQQAGPYYGPSARLVQQRCARRLRRQRRLSSHPAMESELCTVAVGLRWHMECGLGEWHYIRVARLVACKAGETGSVVQSAHFAQGVGIAAHYWPDYIASSPANTVAAAECSQDAGRECWVGGHQYIRV